MGGPQGDLVWIKVDGLIVGLNKDLYLGLVYIKPGKNKDIFHQLDRDIVQYSSRVDIMLLGDFSGGTGSSDDFIRNGSSKDLPLPPQYAEDSNIIRNNCDTKRNDFGKTHLELCVLSRVRILNARYLGIHWVLIHASRQTVVSLLTT